MKTSLTKGLSIKDKEEVKASFASSALFRERVIMLLQEKQRVSRNASISTNAYLEPNWAYKQADQCGYERALEEVISLLES